MHPILKNSKLMSAFFVYLSQYNKSYNTFVEFNLLQEGVSVFIKNNAGKSVVYSVKPTTHEGYVNFTAYIHNLTKSLDLKIKTFLTEDGNLGDSVTFGLLVELFNDLMKAHDVEPFVMSEFTWSEDKEETPEPTENITSAYPREGLRDFVGLGQIYGDLTKQNDSGINLNSQETTAQSGSIRYKDTDIDTVFCAIASSLKIDKGVLAKYKNEPEVVKLLQEHNRLKKLLKNDEEHIMLEFATRQTLHEVFGEIANEVNSSVEGLFKYKSDPEIITLVKNYTRVMFKSPNEISKDKFNSLISTIKTILLTRLVNNTTVSYTKEKEAIDYQNVQAKSTLFFAFSIIADRSNVSMEYLTKYSENEMVQKFVKDYLNTVDYSKARETRKAFDKLISNIQQVVLTQTPPTNIT